MIKSVREAFETVLGSRHGKHADIRSAILDLIQRAANQIRKTRQVPKRQK